MKKEQKSSQNNKQLEEQIQAAVEEGLDIKDSVRQITIKALTEGGLDTKSVRNVAEAVVKGAGFGALNQGAASKEILHKAVSGLDEALSKAAEASALAMKEAAGRGETFSNHELKRILSDVEGFEALFLEALQDGAITTKLQISSILQELSDHAKNSGTAVGKQLEEGLKGLVGEVSKAGESQLKSGIEEAQTTTILFSKLAVGILEGLAESIEVSANPSDHPKTTLKDKTK